MNQKEREKFEALCNEGKNKGYLKTMNVSATNPGQMFMKGTKHGKIILNPLGSNGENNL